MIKVSIKQKYITIIHIYAPNKRALKYMKQTLTELKEEIVLNNTWRLQYFPLSIMDRGAGEKMAEE